MGPDFVIQRVIAEVGGEWAETEGVAARDEGKPDEGLPAVKRPIVEHLEKDANDPNAAEALETIHLFDTQKQKCHDQVKWIFSHPRNNNAQTIEKAKEMRAAALETWKRVQAQLAQKIKDDALITEFNEGHRVNITLIGAENLPLFDQVCS
jgi:soluble cytochrome b562